jgi:hypothetical protein
MILRKFYLAVLSLTLLIMGGSLILINGEVQDRWRGQRDVPWMERMRRNALEEIAPIRARIRIASEQPITVLVEGSLQNNAATVSADASERMTALGVLSAVRKNILESSEWPNSDESAVPQSSASSRSLFEVKDRLWETTLHYVDCLQAVYSGERDVSSNEILAVEEQVGRLERLLDQEIERRGLEPVELPLDPTNLR